MYCCNLHCFNNKTEVKTGVYSSELHAKCCVQNQCIIALVFIFVVFSLFSKVRPNSLIQQQFCMYVKWHKTQQISTMSDFFYETPQKKDSERCMFIVQGVLDLMRISLLRFFKKSIILPYANFGLFYFISAIFWAKITKKIALMK